MSYLPVSIISLFLEISRYTLIAFIVYRIWSIQKATPYGLNEKTSLSRVIRILVESGLIYTMSFIILFVVSMLSNTAQYSVSEAVSRLVCFLTLPFLTLSPVKPFKIVQIIVSLSSEIFRHHDLLFVIPGHHIQPDHHPSA